MKKLLLLPALMLCFGCEKVDLEPDPTPEPDPIIVKDDTSSHSLINTWTCYQYEYTHSDGKSWIMQTNWKVQYTGTEFKIDEAADGEYEKVYTVSSEPGVIVINYPDGPKIYEARAKFVGTKKGYDLVCIEKDNRPDIYSLIKD